MLQGTVYFRISFVIREESIVHTRMHGMAVETYSHKTSIQNRMQKPKCLQSFPVHANPNSQGIQYLTPNDGRHGPRPATGNAPAAEDRSKAAWAAGLKTQIECDEVLERT